MRGTLPENCNACLGLNERAGERVRTVDNDVGNVVLYQLSYARIGEWVYCTLFFSSCKAGGVAYAGMTDTRE